MWTREDCLAFAANSADAAFAYANEYSSLQDSIDIARENIRCTLAEHGCSKYEYEAWIVFDSHVSTKRGI